MDVVTKTKMHFRKEQWKKFIQNREASGLSVAAWCKQNGVAQSTYFKWLHRIRRDYEKKSVKSKNRYSMIK